MKHNLTLMKSPLTSDLSWETTAVLLENFRKRQKLCLYWMELHEWAMIPEFAHWWATSPRCDLPRTSSRSLCILSMHTQNCHRTLLRGWSALHLSSFKQRLSLASGSRHFDTQNWLLDCPSAHTVTHTHTQAPLYHSFHISSGGGTATCSDWLLLNCHRCAKVLQEAESHACSRYGSLAVAALSVL